MMFTNALQLAEMVDPYASFPILRFPKKIFRWFMDG